jgi:superfamily II DNA or RNA helicase
VLAIPTVRIDGAAGTGKTFLALHDILTNLRQDRTVLFVTRNTALAYFAAGWAYRRLRLHTTSKRAMVAMEHFWTLSLDKGEVELRKCKITEQTSKITFIACDSMYPSVYRLLLDPKCPPFSFELVVVDEAHHGIWRKGTWQGTVLLL